VAIIGQTSDLAPADRRFYATRDITATVESIALITASILSKKLAAGLDVLVMDVKAGSGAFMPSMEQSIALAERIVQVGNGAGVRTRALITEMSQPLASSAGNSLETLEAIRYLRGEAAIRACTPSPWRCAVKCCWPVVWHKMLPMLASVCMRHWIPAGLPRSSRAWSVRWVDRQTCWISPNITWQQHR
jgi:hypothetical protein